MRTYEISHNGFHGRRTLTFRPLAVAIGGGWGVVSAEVAHRLNHEVCGINDCRCGESLACQGSDGVWRVHMGPGGEMRGKYPRKQD